MCATAIIMKNKWVCDEQTFFVNKKVERNEKSIYGRWKKKLLSQIKAIICTKIDVVQFREKKICQLKVFKHNNNTNLSCF